MGTDVAAAYVRTDLPGNTKKTPENLRKFLHTLSRTANVSASARSIGCTPRITYVWKAEPDLMVEDSDGGLITFAAAWADAIEEATDELEKYARLWGTEGLPEPLTYQGELMYQRYLKDDELLGIEAGQLVLDAKGNPIPLVVNQRNPRMLEILLKAHRPGKFRENVHVDHEHRGGVLLIAGGSDGKAESGEDWEARADAEQAGHRSAPVVESTAVEVKKK